MKHYVTVALAVLLWVAAGSADGLAQVKAVRMKIDGYLCGF
jgi:hypothetical protein